jgi:hypothetical protein
VVEHLAERPAAHRLLVAAASSDFQEGGFASLKMLQAGE